ncbi:AmiS/UreI family transporter [Rathayibacter soli]|uniref:AmiS/UreI family transporter n=1 Tax=Rathayibacter soli TaxID=3144168 RepID=UPI0027E415CA|nr:AmiS/UreI family transporter [Glaciibacter superstes]
MSYICLILSGAALLVNGLGLLGRIPARDSGYFNLLIGGTQLLLCALLAVAANGNSTALLSVSGVFLFGLTYTYVGLDSLRGLGSVGLGWFCGLVAALGLFYAAASIATNPLLSVLWLSWAGLWTLFFLLLALGKTGLTAYTGWALILTSQVTTTVPAILGLTGTWPTDAPAAIIALVAIAALFVLAIFLAAPAANRAPRTSAAVPTAVPASIPAPVPVEDSADSLPA